MSAPLRSNCYEIPSVYIALAGAAKKTKRPLVWRLWRMK